MVRTVPRSSVAKWPDSGATSSTRGCAASMSFLKCSSVPNGVVSAARSCTATSRLPTMTAVDAEGGTGMGQPGAGDQLVGRGQVAQDGVVGDPGQWQADGLQGRARPAADRHHDVGMGLIGLIEHSPKSPAAARYSCRLAPLPRSSVKC